MLTLLLIATSILLALSGLALVQLANAYRNLEQQVKTLQLHLDDMLETDAVNDQLTAHNRELNAELNEVKTLCAEYIGTITRAYNREQELLVALEDANKAADDNEWLFNDARQCELDAVKELEELQEVHRAYVEGMTTAEAEQAAEIAELTAHINTNHQDIDELYNELAKKNNHIADLKASLKNCIDYWDKAAKKGQAARNELAAVKEELAETIEGYQIEIHHKVIRIAELKRNLKALKEELAETKTLADNLMSDRIEAIAHMRQQNEKIAEHELKEFYDSCDDLDEAIEAAAPQEDIIHLDDNKVWTAIGDWTRLIVYASSPYHCYIQKAIDGPIKRLAAAQITDTQRPTVKALKQAVKFI